MTGFVMMLLFLLLPTFLILLVIIIVLQVVFNGDRFQHPEEYADKGKEGERIIYRTLVDQIHVPENQILRNVYVPTANGKTSEIDLLVISKKGILLFECKNYAGNIYGDAKRNKWIQYLGKKKAIFIILSCKTAPMSNISKNIWKNTEIFRLFRWSQLLREGNGKSRTTDRKTICSDIIVI